MFRFLQFRFLAVCIFCALNGFAQPFIPERNQLPQVQYRTPYPVETAAAVPGTPRLVAQTRFAYSQNEPALVDSTYYRYYKSNGRNAPGSPQRCEAMSVRLQYDHSGNCERRSFQSCTAEGKPAVYRQQRRNTATGAWVDLCRQSFSYAQGTLLRDTTWDWDEMHASWIVSACTDYFRDGAGHADRVLIRSRNKVTGSLDSAAELRYVFNDAGKVVECTSRYGAGRLQLSGRQTVTYSDAGYLTGTCFQRWDSTLASWKAARGFRFVTGSNNERLMQEELQWNASRGEWAKSDELGTRYSYSYDQAGRLIAMIRHNGIVPADSSWDRYEYTYNALGQRTEAVHRSSDRKSATGAVCQYVDEKISFYYEQRPSGHITDQPDDNLRIWPVPAVNQLNIDIRSVRGQPYRVMVKDMQGRNVRTWSRSAGAGDSDQIGLSGISSGTYNLFLQTGRGKPYVARLVIAE